MIKLSRLSHYNSVNITPIEVELMAIRTGLISAMEINNIHNITVITDSIAAARKILEYSNLMSPGILLCS